MNQGFTVGNIALKVIHVALKIFHVYFYTEYLFKDLCYDPSEARSRRVVISKSNTQRYTEKTRRLPLQFHES